jgi:hypothetical protein
LLQVRRQHILFLMHFMAQSFVRYKNILEYLL